MEKPRYPAANKERRPAVAILGFTDTRSLAPFGDPRFEIWGINEMYQFMDPKLFTRWFEIHDRSMLPDAKHFEALAKIPCPVYMQEHYDDVPNSVPFPKDEIEKECGTKYFTSSIAWMQGMAILEGFEEVHIYGVDLAQETEYFEQRPACEYLIGMMQGRGIKIYVPPQSDLLKTVGQYGWPTSAGDFRLKLDERIKFLNNQREQFVREQSKMQNNLNVILANLHKIDGALEDCGFWKRSWSHQSAVNPEQPFIDRSQDPRVNVDRPASDGKPPVAKKEEKPVNRLEQVKS